MTSSIPSSLHGQRIAVPETRQLDVFANLLQRRGAEVLRCPLVSIHDAPDEKPIVQWLEKFIAGEFDDFIILTGEGLRRLLGFAERAGCRDDFVAALAQIRTLVRGPKPAKVLREYKLAPSLIAAAPTTDGVITTLQQLDLTGRSIAVQLYGDYANPPLIQAITAAGAVAVPVAPYRYADEVEAQAVLDLITELRAGKLDAIAFTSAAQVNRLYKLAAKTEQVTALTAALNQLCVAAVGPVIKDLLASKNVAVKVMPESQFFLKPLVQQLALYFAAR